MLLPRRPPPAPEQAAAAARVRGLLPGREPGGWVLPPETATGPAAPEPGAAPSGPVAVDPVLVDPVLVDPLPVDPGPVDPGPVEPVLPPVAAAPVLPGLRERLTSGRLDPGRRAVVGLGLVGVLACLVAGWLVLQSAPHEVAPPPLVQAGRPVQGASLGAAATPSPTAEVVVAVAGDVRRPGLVRLAAGSRVDDAVRAAGGLRAGASVGLLNLARRLVDGEQVVVGGPASAAAGPADGSAAAAPAGGLVDLNTATAAQLDGLPGIGPVLAERIVDYRTAHGPFRSVDQLREVSGIGEAKYQSLHDAVTV